MSNTQPEALRLIQHMDDEWPEDWDGLAIRAELRRLHTENEFLRGQSLVKAGPPYKFQRFVAGQKRAQDVVIEKEEQLQRAVLKAARICPPAELTVLVYTSQQPAEPYDELTQALIERDEYHAIADELAEKIVEITGADIGEHSSANNPWLKALEVADDWLMRHKTFEPDYYVYNIDGVYRLADPQPTIRWGNK
jgi:hypothetical protein